MGDIAALASIHWVFVAMETYVTNKKLPGPDQGVSGKKEFVNLVKILKNRVIMMMEKSYLKTRNEKS